MRYGKTLRMAAAVLLASLGTQAMADVSCGLNNGQAATGAPIIVGGIYGDAAPGDWSSSTDSAAAYFRCVNANGGINGRPIDYRVENDQWNPEAAARAAALLVNDTPTVAMVGNGSFIEMVDDDQGVRFDIRAKGLRLRGRGRPSLTPPLVQITRYHRGHGALQWWGNIALEEGIATVDGVEIPLAEGSPGGFDRTLGHRRRLQHWNWLAIVALL